MKNSIIFLVVLSLMVACKNEKKDKFLSPINKNINITNVNISTSENDISTLDIDNSKCEVINIPKDIFKSTIIINKLLKDINFIPLETNNKCLIGNISNILSDSGFYFIHDQRNNKLYRFDYNGKFLNSIGVIGHGPQEVNSIWNVSIDKQKKLISILDTGQAKIVRYNYQGVFFDVKPLYYFYKQHEYEKNNLVLNKGKSINNIGKLGSYSLILSDTNQKPIYKAFKYNFENNKPTNTFTTIRPLRKFKDRVYYHHPHSNGIWQISDSELIPIMRFNYEEKGLPDDTWKLKVNRKEMIDILGSHIYFSGDYVINNEFCYFKIIGKNNVSSFFFNRNTKEYIYGNTFEEIKGKPFNLDLFEDPISCRDDNSFIAIKSSSSLAYLKEAILKYPEMKKKITSEDWNKLKKINVNSNPIIVTYSLKDF